MHFTPGLSTSVVNFHNVVRDILTYVGTCNYRGAASASLAISEMALPTFMTTKKPGRPVLTAMDGEEVISDGLARMLIVEYEQQMSEYAGLQEDARQESNNWKENGPKIWNLLITHCPKNVITRLEAQADFEENKKKRNPI